MSTVTPVSAPSTLEFLVGSMSLTTGVVTTSQVAAAGAFTNTSILDISKCRTIGLWLWVDSVASVSAAQTGFRVLVSGVGQINGATPAATQDVWCAVSGNDGSVTSAAESGAMPASMVMTASPNWGEITSQRFTWKSTPTSSATDRERQVLLFTVATARWLMVQYAAIADTSHRCQVAIAVSKDS